MSPSTCPSAPRTQVRAPEEAGRSRDSPPTSTPGKRWGPEPAGMPQSLQRTAYRDQNKGRGEHCINATSMLRILALTCTIVMFEPDTFVHSCISADKYGSLRLPAAQLARKLSAHCAGVGVLQVYLKDHAQPPASTTASKTAPRVAS